MTGRRLRAALLLTAVPAAAAGAVTLTLRAGHRRLHADRHRIELSPLPRRSCPDCRGEGGW
ncbi:hypothetical protein ACFW6S_31270 [Streptomyces sp. NPDC058740]|uniref:hypothetical protein n=1 Tax=Streptomyces sp. NPDC058740 TaxID=3346619 RepID=UPI0036C68022